MRKWMRDRLKRKKPEAGKGEPGPAPLQPAYFDAAPGAAAVDENSQKTHELKSEVSEVYDAQPAEEEPADAPRRPTASSTDDSPQPKKTGGPAEPRRRRRRGRGGRGRGGARPAVAAPSAGAATESAPEGDAQMPVSPAAAKTPTTAAPRTSKGSVILAIGLPGSGKSSWFKRHKITPLSSDILRGMLFDDPTEQRFQDLIFSNLRSMLKARLIARRPLNYVDATNLTPHERQSWVKLGHDYGYEVQAVFFDVPLEVCLQRNQRRERVVAEDVMRRMSSKLKPPTFEEGFSKITVVRVKAKE
jgi:predicted kinase